MFAIWWLLSVPLLAAKEWTTMLTSVTLRFAIDAILITQGLSVSSFRVDNLYFCRLIIICQYLYLLFKKEERCVSALSWSRFSREQNSTKCCVSCLQSLFFFLINWWSSLCFVFLFHLMLGMLVILLVYVFFSLLISMFVFIISVFFLVQVIGHQKTSLLFSPCHMQTCLGWLLFWTSSLPFCSLFCLLHYLEPFFFPVLCKLWTSPFFLFLQV